MALLRSTSRHGPSGRMGRAEARVAAMAVTMVKTIMTVLILGALALSPGMSVAAEAGHSLEEVVVEMADTPAEHAALARHFRAKAEEARAEAKRHEGMGRAYGSGKLTQQQRMRKHCANISNDLNDIAAEFDALATVHEQAAKQ